MQHAASRGLGPNRQHSAARHRKRVERSKLGIFNCSHLSSRERDERAAEQRALESAAINDGIELVQAIPEVGRVIWRSILNATAALNRPRATALTSTSECMWNLGLPADVILVTDRLTRALRGRPTPSFVTPFVVSRPPWLIGAASPPTPPPWEVRKLLFFAGHVPKLFVSPIRYLLWRQLRRSPHATTLSHSIVCSVGSYAVCLNESAVATTFEAICRRIDISTGSNDIRIGIGAQAV